MAQRVQVGIHGIGVYLPEPIRRNDWWPKSIVDGWRARMREGLVRPEQDRDTTLTDGARLTLAAMAEYQDDPFAGGVERRVMPEGMVSSDMEVAAAQDALARAGVAPGEVDLLLVNSQLPDYLSVPTAPIVHRRLGLPERCFTSGTDASSNSFLTQLTLAEQMIKGGQTRYALLVQSSGLLHLARQEDPHSGWFGDAATAVVIGPVSEGKGVLGQAHRTDGRMYEALVSGCPGSHWYSGGRIQLYVKDPAAARVMLLHVADFGKQVVEEALQAAGARHEDVQFYACHQATGWFRRVTQEHIGLKHARSFDAFPFTGSLTACNIPFVLAMGERKGLLGDGDLIATYTGGSGITWSSTVLRWGR